MTKKEAILFLEKLATDNYSKAEYTVFLNFLNQCDVDVYSEIIDLWEEVLERNERQKKPFIKHKSKSTYKALSVAAAILAVISLGIYFFVANGLTNPQIKTLSAKHIKPGGNNAVLTLADGREILLEDTHNGEIESNNGIKIIKTADGQLVYEVLASENKEEAVHYNSISTPRGGQYQIKLPDGTRVWLNAATTFRYPTSFVGKERIVELEGEGYFEVARNAKMPFKVRSHDQEITVLGTHFNVNTYSDNGEVLTTVAEGTVRVQPHPLTDNLTNASVILNQNQQASLNLKNNQLKVNNVQSALILAWKSGKFQFEDTPIGEVLQQFSRWYNVDFEYKAKDANIKLWGDVNRNVNAEEALEILKFFGLKYSFVLDGVQKKIIVTN